GARPVDVDHAHVLHIGEANPGGIAAAVDAVTDDRGSDAGRGDQLDVQMIQVRMDHEVRQGQVAEHEGRVTDRDVEVERGRNGNIVAALRVDGIGDEPAVGGRAGGVAVADGVDVARDVSRRVAAVGLGRIDHQGVVTEVVPDEHELAA